MTDDENISDELLITEEVKEKIQKIQYISVAETENFVKSFYDMLKKYKHPDQDIFINISISILANLNATVLYNNLKDINDDIEECKKLLDIFFNECKKTILNKMYH